MFLLVLAYPLVPDKRPLNGCLCVCVRVLQLMKNNQVSEHGFFDKNKTEFNAPEFNVKLTAQMTHTALDLRR